MGRFKRFFQKKNRNVANISLFIIFAVLLIQSAILIFLKGAGSVSLDQLDTVFRTTMSSIFGFFMSSSAIKKSEKMQSNITDEPRKIGFSANATATQPQASLASEYGEPLVPSDVVQNVGASQNSAPQPKIQYNLQVIILTSVCLFCLLIMITVRYFSGIVAEGNNTIITLSLYRDFISGSVGAIIGLARSGD